MYRPPIGVKSWKGPYINRPVTHDEWGGKYHYITPAPGRKIGYEVLSYGADGKPGGSGDDADLSNGNDN